MKLKENYKTMREICCSVTGKNFLTVKYESARSYLNLWFNAIEWTNNGLPLSESIDMEKCTKNDVNKLSQAVKNYLNEIVGNDKIRMRHFFQKRDENKIANENRNAAHFETLFSQHWRQLVRKNKTGQKKKVHMILGVHP